MFFFLITVKKSKTPKKETGKKISYLSKKKIENYVFVFFFFFLCYTVVDDNFFVPINKLKLTEKKKLKVKELKNLTKKKRTNTQPTRTVTIWSSSSSNNYLKYFFLLFFLFFFCKFWQLIEKLPIVFKRNFIKKKKKNLKRWRPKRKTKMKNDGTKMKMKKTKKKIFSMLFTKNFYFFFYPSLLRLLHRHLNHFFFLSLLFVFWLHII